MRWPSACMHACLPSCSYSTHLCESNFEDESSHLRDTRGALLEALQVVPREHEVPLLPPGEYSVALEIKAIVAVAVTLTQILNA